MQQGEFLGVYGSFFSVQNLFSALTTCSFVCNCSQQVPSLPQAVERAVPVGWMKGTPFCQWKDSKLITNIWLRWFSLWACFSFSVPLHLFFLFLSVVECPCHSPPLCLHPLFLLFFFFFLILFPLYFFLLSFLVNINCKGTLDQCVKAFMLEVLIILREIKITYHLEILMHIHKSPEY